MKDNTSKELSKEQVGITKGVAIMMMVALHLFCTKAYLGKFDPLIIFNSGVPLVYYIGLFGDACIVIYCFCSGYGLYLNYIKDNQNYNISNGKRVFKLFVNYWIILILALAFGILTKNPVFYPINFEQLVLTFTGISPYYNGAWWFMTTYCILIIISPIVFKYTKKGNDKFILLVFFIMYSIGFMQRIHPEKLQIIQFQNSILIWFMRQFGLLGTSIFPFIIGALFAKNKWYSSLLNFVKSKISYVSLLAIIGICLLIVFHAYVETMYVAVFTGISFIVFFNWIKLNTYTTRILNFIGGHSTNIWLLHMFLYLVFIPKIIFSPKYPLFIFLWLMLLSILVSIFVNIIYKPIMKSLIAK